MQKLSRIPLGYSAFCYIFAHRVMHSAHHNYKLNIMTNHVGNFPLCGGCSRKEKNEKCGEGEFYCYYAEGVFPNGIVTSDVDGTDCHNKGLYKSVI